MQKGEILEVEIAGSGMSGEGVARVDGFVIFIAGALVGETVKCEVTFVKKSFANARIIKIVVPSVDRREPLCPVFYRCGGCDMQHIDYVKQLEFKRANLISCIEKECKLSPNVDEVVYGAKQYGYRNKIQVPIGMQDGRIVLGYFKPNSHTQVPFARLDECILKESKLDIGDCPLHNKAMQQFVDCFCEFANEQKLSVYDEYSGRGLLRHFVLRQIGDTFSVVVVVSGNDLPNSRRLIEKLDKLMHNYSLSVCKNTKDTNVIMTDNIKTIKGDIQIVAEVLGVKVKVSPLSFLQVNDEIRDKIYEKVGEIIKNTPNSQVIELYSGVGILSNIMALSADNVYAVEIVSQAVKDANVLAKMNNNQNKIMNICGDVAVVLPQLIKDIHEKFMPQSQIEDSVAMPRACECSKDFVSNNKTVSLNAATIRCKHGNLTNINTDVVGDRAQGNLSNSDTDVIGDSTQGNLSNLDTDVIGDRAQGNLSNSDTDVTVDCPKVNLSNPNTIVVLDPPRKGCGGNVIDLPKCNSGNPKTVVVLDPPRKGCDAIVLESILNAAPSKIVYISCNPATLSRDLKFLLSDYVIDSVIPYDMFPQTAHVETLCCLVRKN